MFNKKKKYFKEKLSGVVKMIWDFEFKRQKTRMIREEVRQEYDRQKSAFAVLTAKIARERSEQEAIGKENVMKPEDVARLDDQRVLMERDISRFEQQMKALDLEIDGSKPTGEYPDGVQGINHQLDALHELEGMLKEYIKTL